MGTFCWERQLGCYVWSHLDSGPHMASFTPKPLSTLGDSFNGLTYPPCFMSTCRMSGRGGYT